MKSQSHAVADLLSRPLLVAWLPVAFLLASYVALGFGASTTPVASASSCQAWSLVPSPNIPTKINVLTSVAASSSNDIWAVGYWEEYGNTPNTAQTLAMHWDGKEWKIVPTLNPSAIGNYLDGVAVIAPDNAWAVGDSGTSDKPQSILLHWDGAAWTPGKLPPLGNDGHSLYSIKAVSANSIWAAGVSGNRKFSNGLVLHYDGNDWLISLNITFKMASILYGVNARSANDVWAVGAKATEKGVLDLRMHWNGTAWAQVEEERAVGLSLASGGDVALSPTTADTWIVSAGSGPRLSILHFDGGAWRRNDIDPGLNTTTQVSGVVAVSGTEAWAAGSGKTGTSVQPIFVHTTNGNDWQVMPGGKIDGNGALYDIAALPGGEYIAVGTANGATLIERYGDPCAPPPAPPTTTPMPIAPTPTAIANPTFPPTPIPGENSRAFPETGKTIKGIFLDYWEKGGGLAQQGYPISEMFSEISPLDGKVYTVQYFERAVFEYHPENQAPYNILLSQPGTFQYKQKYPTGSQGQTANTLPDSQLFSETGKRVGGKFLDYWQKNGGLAQQGYPISDEFQEKSDLDGKIYTVQYFERAVFEMHPENAGTPYEVLLSQLGAFQYKQKYGSGK